ncbi:RNA-binding protein RO60 isoform X3 [Salmo trutta]|uniref:RNA-binding protein RO60 isoform X3 n=1 Tax=Salmo trutta TaxID=8032 RepID=UPI001130D04E|nr:60 kDa SS-A/Ro ribonucleoprotein isoform X3 [Salmo trutta]
MEPLGQDANDHGQNSVGDGVHPWEVTDMTRLRRFICYGSEMAIYDTKEHRLGMESALALLSLLQEGRGCEVVEEVKRLALEGRPVRTNPSLFALAVCSQHLDLNTRRGAFRALSDVCRAPEHLFTFIQYKKEAKERMRCGIWGRALRKAVSDWYNKQDAMGLALAVTKCKTREGWSHQDLLRLSHAKPANEAIVLISKYIMKGWKEVQGAYADKENSEEVIKVLSYLEAVEKVKHSADEMEVSHLIEEHSLEREQLLTDHLKSKAVWKALLKEMPMESMLRTLGKMTADQVLEPGSSDVAEVCERIQSEAALKKAKLHPFSVLTASENYKRGQGNRGKVKWEPDVDIIKALDSAFYKCFTIFARTEAETQVMAYSEGAIVPCTITEGMSLRQVATELVKIPSGYTDCALPILWASEKTITVDMFIIFTNTACWHGEANPAECLRMYRHKMGIFSKLMVCGLTSNGLSIADPAEDRGMLDLCGFDLGAIEVIRNLALDLI